MRSFKVIQGQKNTIRKPGLALCISYNFFLTKIFSAAFPEFQRYELITIAIVVVLTYILLFNNNSIVDSDLITWTWPCIPSLRQNWPEIQNYLTFQPNWKRENHFKCESVTDHFKITIYNFMKFSWNVNNWEIVRQYIWQNFIKIMSGPDQFGKRYIQEYFLISQAFGWDSWVPMALKSIFGMILFLNQLHDFLLLSWNLFLHPFLKSKFTRKNSLKQKNSFKCPISINWNKRWVTLVFI